MGRLIGGLLLAVCAACSHPPRPAVITNPDGNGPQIVVWGPPGSNAGDGGSGGGM